MFPDHRYHDIYPNYFKEWAEYIGSPFPATLIIVKSCGFAIRRPGGRQADISGIVGEVKKPVFGRRTPAARQRRKRQ